LRFAIVQSIPSFVLPYLRVLEVGGALRLRLEAKEISPLFASTLQPPASNIKKPNCIGLSENAIYGLVRYKC